MSCESNLNRISNWAGQLGAGIVQLTGKRAFYAGLALGGMGLFGAGLVALARRQSDAQPADRQPAPFRLKPIPQLAARTKIKPAAYLSPEAQCGGCNALARSKSGAWYAFNGRRYCPDCAPAAAQQADLELVSPGAVASGETTRSVGSVVAAQSNRQGVISSSRGREPAYLPPERRVETRLEPSRIGLNIGSASEPIRFVVEQGYVLLRPDGLDTGLAITPDLDVERHADGQVQVQEDTGRWWLTHIPSGRTLVSQPYSSLAEAQMLGNILAQLDWTRAETEIPAGDYRRASATIALYNQSLAQAKQEDRPASGLKGGLNDKPAAPITTQRLPNDVSLEGRLVADGYGGVSRVLEDNGSSLFLIDSLGKRYEIARHEARTPDESDFELCRVAMSFDPTQQPEANCAKCRRSTRQTGAGEMWYKMGWQAFCESCATEHAAEEGYIKEEEIDSNLEALGS